MKQKNLELTCDCMISIDLLHQNIGLFTDFDEYIACVKSVDSEFLMSEVQRFPQVAVPIDENGVNWFMCYIPPGTTREQAVHESVHLAMFILEYIDQGISVDNHEILCYLVSYIFKSICNCTKIK